MKQSTTIVKDGGLDVPTATGWSVVMLRLLFERRATSLLLVGVAVFYLMLLNAGVVVFRCPLHSTTGLNCAGCGLSTAMLAMFQGRFAVMLRQHPFAPYFAFFGAVVLVSVVLPEKPRQGWISFLLRMEQQTRLHAAMLSLFVVFGAVRLLVQAVQPG